VEAKFLGGEPFLEPETFRVWDLMRELGLETPCSVTTNGTQWNKRVERVVESLPTSITISMDAATAGTYESIRVGADHAEVMANVRRFDECARRRGTTLTFTFCLMSVNWFEFADFLLFVEGLGRTTGVNTVPDPAEFDVEKLPFDELRTVVAEMERQEAAKLGDLVLNRRVWDLHLGRLRSLLEAKERGTEVWIMRPYDGSGDGPYIGQDLGPDLGPDMGPDLGPSMGPDMGPPGPRPVEGAVDRARALAVAWAAGGRVDELAVDPDQRIVSCDPAVAGCATAGWAGTDAWETIGGALGTDPAGWGAVEIDETSVSCVEGVVVRHEGGSVRMRFYSADDVVGPGGRLGYRVFVARAAERAGLVR
jgi:hypothetical protein